jgi:hypothetical protein
MSICIRMVHAPEARLSECALGSIFQTGIVPEAVASRVPCIKITTLLSMTQPFADGMEE